MDRSTEIALVQQLLTLQASNSAFLDPDVSASAVDNYFDPERFEREQTAILRTTPQAVVHSSELPQPGAFLRRDLAGLPVLFTRDSDGEAHAFLNVCRHRGTRLVADSSGCKHRFACPYHAWTWNNRGELLRIPHEAQGFPTVDREKMGLKRLGCIERHGWIWVDGIAPRFETRGWCAQPGNWINTVLESHDRQRHHRGAMHPNVAGYEAIGEEIAEVLASVVAGTPPSPPASCPAAPELPADL